MPPMASFRAAWLVVAFVMATFSATTALPAHSHRLISNRCAALDKPRRHFVQCILKLRSIRSPAESQHRRPTLPVPLVIRPLTWRADSVFGQLSRHLASLSVGWALLPVQGRTRASNLRDFKPSAARSRDVMVVLALQHRRELSWWLHLARRHLAWTGACRSCSCPICLRCASSTSLFCNCF